MGRPYGTLYFCSSFLLRISSSLRDSTSGAIIGPSRFAGLFDCPQVKINNDLQLKDIIGRYDQDWRVIQIGGRPITVYR
jgi:hypothetical protein